ncbi:DUF429 domain-containing protein [Natronococcus wangiae]|uniref:DUF429 domain-containing protein n=1 Tax=Natronococcus wangiae TaxID=3068275 RepID=UPI00273E2952|nr:DUF429 domain-containing protein [Natronococcus sp. AD5]
MTAYVGIDACSAGWFASILEDGEFETTRYQTFDDVWEVHSSADRILVDIPIGLPEEGTRTCDTDARALLGCRGVSVFDTICRPLLALEDYETANERYRELAGKGLTKQAWYLREKIEQVDAVVRNDERTIDVIYESHPELCFYSLNDRNPVAYSKSSDRGRSKRLGLLSESFEHAEPMYENAEVEYLRKNVARDDILDSMVLAVAARSDLVSLPTDGTDRDPWMKIWYPKPE